MQNWILRTFYSWIFFDLSLCSQYTAGSKTHVATGNSQGRKNLPSGHILRCVYILFYSVVLQLLSIHLLSKKKRLVWTHFLFHIFWSINTVMSVCPRQNSKLFRSTVYFSLGFFFWIYRFYLELKRIFTGEAILHGATHRGIYNAFQSFFFPLPPSPRNLFFPH